MKVDENIAGKLDELQYVAHGILIFGQLGFFRHDDGRVSVRLACSENKPYRKMR